MDGAVVFGELLPDTKDGCGGAEGGRILGLGMGTVYHRKNGKYKVGKAQEDDPHA